MLPVGPLMTEHRLIERMLDVVRVETGKIVKTKKVDVKIVDTAVDFIRTYADALHHGKEEDILFRELAKKKMSQEHERIMKELVEDHKFGRKKVGETVAAKDRYLAGDSSAADDLIDALTAICDFYPKHIAKEDKGFFLPVMKYFTREELDAMIREGDEFDRNFAHVKYKKVVDGFARK
jgi:hemerythrin-like domain-containing protein